MKTRNDLELRKMSDDIYMLEQNKQKASEPFNKIVTFNKTAAMVWREVQDVDFDEYTVSNILMKNYGISMEESLEDSKDLLSTWMDANLAYSIS